MIGLGLRLAVSGGREAVARLATIVAAVALGVGLLLAIVAGVNAVNAQNARYAWLDTGTAPSANGPSSAAADQLWWLLRQDYFDSQTIARVDVAGTGPDAPVPPGIPRLPAPGEFYASPALSAFLASTPPAQLGDRFPGRQVGTIGPSALPEQNSLIVVVGRTPDELARVPDAEQVTRIETAAPAGRAAALKLVLSVVAAALLFPVLIFIGTATRLAAAHREQRFAAMRMVGATPRQVSLISTVESSAGSAMGTAAGFGLFVLFRDELAAIPFTGAPFDPADLRLSVANVLLVALGVPVGAAVAARMALRRVQISPLGVTRRVTPQPPRAYRLIPLLLGLGELAYFVDRRPDTTDGQAAAFLTGFLLVMAGLVIAGPWLTMVGARFMARRSTRPATLIAARRLADDPRAAFRAISGLVLALFVTSVAVGAITTIVANRGVHGNGPAANAILTRMFSNDSNQTAMTARSGTVSADLSSTPGVEAVIVVRSNPADLPEAAATNQPLPGLASCADLAELPTLGQCESGAAVAQVTPDLTVPNSLEGPERVWPAATIPLEELARHPMLSIVVDTDGSTAAIERARTILESAYPNERIAPVTQGDFELDFTRTLSGWQQLAHVIILASLPIAGCSLAASIAGGLSERRRPFSLLRLSGVPVRVLRRVVALESVVPLLVVASVAIGTGFLAAHLFLEAQMDYALEPPRAEYYIIVLAGVAAALGLIASTLPLLQRITGPETARNE